MMVTFIHINLKKLNYSTNYHLGDKTKVARFDCGKQSQCAWLKMLE